MLNLSVFGFQKCLREQMRTFLYDLPTDDSFNIRCAVCMLNCLATRLCATTECCIARVHRKCLDKNLWRQALCILRDCALLATKVPCVIQNFLY